jgi:hypothetical protein
MEHTIFGLIKKRGEITGQQKATVMAAEDIKAYFDIDRALVLCGDTDGPKGIVPRGKYMQLFGRNELKLTVRNMLQQAPADDEPLIEQIIAAKGWDDNVRTDVLKRVRRALQRAQKDGRVLQDFGPNGCLWRGS